MKVKLRKDMSVGSAAAEDDELLKAAFLDKGDLALLRDPTRREAIVVGRTGSGKTALLLMLEESETNVIRIQPEELSIRYLIASSIIPALHEAGIHLEPFYKQMWRHVISVELIRTRYNITNENRQRTLWQSLSSLVSPSRQRDQDLIKYAQEHGDRFWEGTQAQVQEIANELRTKVSGSAEFKGGVVGGEASDERERLVRTISSQRDRVQTAVQQSQLDYLSKIFKLIEKEVFDDPQNPYFVVIDDLDKDWVEAEYAYDLLNALFHIVAEFGRMENVKVVIALRENILEKLYKLMTGKPGQQREKFESFIHRIRWDEETLAKMLEKRVETLVPVALGAPVNLADVLPRPMKSTGQTAIDYMLVRSFRRPRDIITFFNYCIDSLSSSSRLSWKDIKKAERAYSRDRYHSIVDEWSENHPRLDVLIDAFHGAADGFTLEDVEWDRVESILNVGGQTESPAANEPSMLYHAYVNDQMSPLEIAAYVLRLLYRVGVLGAKLNPREPITFSFEEPALLVENTTTLETRFFFHPSLYRKLDIGAGHFE